MTAKRIEIHGQFVAQHFYNTVIVGAGASGMNCAKKLYEYMTQKGITEPHKRIAVVTAGLPLGASRMSGSDKQTYYKMGTSPDVADSAESFAESLMAGGCCHGDLALAEGIGSLRGFYNLVEAGVPFPHDPMGTCIGYKTDHDPYERATSAGPKTSKFMSECLEKIVRGYGIELFDQQEVVELLATGSDRDRRIVGMLTIHKKELCEESLGMHLFCFENLVLASGGPGALYQTSVYPLGQTGIHGIALRSGLAAENLTESQFGLASTQFRWNVSGTYMQAIPRIFSTDANGRDEREFLTDYFPTMSKMATNIFLKGYQWPFDPQRIENHQSSLIDILVFHETQKGRRVFMDFLHNPIGNADMDSFCLDDLEPEALHYLKATGAMHQLPIERLEHMNPPAIEIYLEHDIDLKRRPLEIALCAQHNNGGFAVNKWWESNIPHTFVIGEMAGTHGVKRPGGSALNAGQVGAQRAAEYIANVYTSDVPDESFIDPNQVASVIDRLTEYGAKQSGLNAHEVHSEIQERMTAFAGHIRSLERAQAALKEAIQLYDKIKQRGFSLSVVKDLIAAIEAEHLALASVGYLKAIAVLLKAGGGSRGSYLVLSDDGIVIHPDITDSSTAKPLRFKPENESFRQSILRVQYAPDEREQFVTKYVDIRPVPKDRKAFEPAWKEFRTGRIYETDQ